MTVRARYKVSGLAALALLFLSACASDDSAPADPLRTGVFLDSSAVEGLSYETPTMSGITNANGEFTFNAGEVVTFNVGEVALPAVPGANVITPVSIFGAPDIGDERVVNLSRLLQSLDTDADANNGITLPFGAALDSAASAGSVDFAAGDFDTQASSVLTSLGLNLEEFTAVALVDENTATAQLTESLIDNEIISNGCTSNHPFVARSAELSTRAHGVTGTVTVVDDCTIEVTNFNYDGLGPSVYFYAAPNRDYRNHVAILGSRLNGQLWVNDTVRLPIPDNVTLDDFDSLSVWCSDVNANFGDVFFGDQ